jgi:hypothetical protein
MYTILRGGYLPSHTAEIQNSNSHTIINYRPLKIVKKEIKSKMIHTGCLISDGL